MAMDPAFALLHGFSTQELMRQPVAMLFAPESWDDLSGRLDRISGGQYLEVETMQVRKDGSVFPAWVGVLATAGKDGTLEFLAICVGGPRRGRHQRALSRREFEVLLLLAAGKTDKEIATLLGLSPNTIHNHVSHIIQKMGVHSRTAAVGDAILRGIIADGD